MKRLLFGLLAVTALVMTSCSKEARINKKLDGEWNGTMVDGETPAAGETYTMTFTKDKKDNGTGSMSVSDGSFSFTLPFTYTLSEDKLTMVTTFGSETDTETVTITTWEKDRIEWTNTDGDKTILEAK